MVICGGVQSIFVGRLWWLTALVREVGILTHGPKVQSLFLKQAVSLFSIASASPGGVDCRLRASNVFVANLTDFRRRTPPPVLASNKTISRGEKTISNAAVMIKPIRSRGRCFRVCQTLGIS